MDTCSLKTRPDIFSVADQLNDDIIGSVSISNVRRRDGEGFGERTGWWWTSGQLPMFPESTPRTSSVRPYPRNSANLFITNVHLRFLSSDMRLCVRQRHDAPPPSR